MNPATVKFTGLRNSACIALAIALTAPAPAADAVWPSDSASDLSTFVTLQRLQVQAGHCSAKVPQLKPKFDSVMENLNSRIQGISKGLLASDMFKGMKGKPVPAPIVFALEDSLDDARHNFERQDADSICPKTLQTLGAMDDESLKSRLTDTFTAIQNMIRNLATENARQGG